MHHKRVLFAAASTYRHSALFICIFGVVEMITTMHTLTGVAPFQMKTIHAAIHNVLKTTKIIYIWLVIIFNSHQIWPTRMMVGRCGNVEI